MQIFPYELTFLGCICTSFNGLVSLFLDNCFFFLIITLTLFAIHALLLGNTLTCFDGTILLTQEEI